MTPSERQALTAERFGRWAAALARVEATPFLLIGIGHESYQLHVFVPHHDHTEVTLMARMLRQLADELEAHGPADAQGHPAPDEEGQTDDGCGGVCGREQ